MAAAVAEHLRRPCVTQAASLDRRRRRLTVKRQVETGYDTIEVPLPAVLSVSDAINEPRYPSLPAIMGAKRKPHEVLRAADAGLDAGAVAPAGRAPRWRGCRRRPRKGDGMKIEDEGDAAEHILAFLVERKLVV